MTRPTLSARLARKCIVLSADDAFAERVRAALPAGWEMTATTDIGTVGDFAAVLLHRFVLLDLEPHAALDAIATIRRLRTELMLNIPVFCFGGDAARRDEARLNRADRFFERTELEGVLPDLCRQFGWGA